MKTFYYLLLACLLVNCSTDKELKLPEIQHSNITEILDVSPAYIFYNVNEKDSTELNKQNLISTTNWLVNIDKRLTLNQAIPHVIALQKKKEDASHKNKASKNYFTAFHAELKTLCFINFTGTIYHLNDRVKDYMMNTNSDANLVTITSDSITYKDESLSYKAFITTLDTAASANTKLVLNFDHQLTFQNYMQFKDELLSLTNTSILIDQNEFVF